MYHKSKHQRYAERMMARCRSFYYNCNLITEDLTVLYDQKPPPSLEWEASGFAGLLVEIPNKRRRR